MKKLLNHTNTFEDLKHAVIDLQKREDKKGFYIFAAIVTALVVATLCGVVYVLKKKMDDDFDEDWDCDWEDELDDLENGDCCCTDKDVDTTVKVEKL